MDRVREYTADDSPGSQLASCYGKQGFASPQQAQAVLRARPNLCRNKVYHCQQCGRYHIGAEFWPRKNKAAKQRRRREADPV